MTTENGLIITPVTGGETRSYVTNPNEWMGNVHAETDPVTGVITLSTGGADIPSVGPAFTWAGKPAASAASGVVIRVTDVGPAGFGSMWFSDGSNWRPLSGRQLLSANRTGTSAAPLASSATVAKLALPTGDMVTSGSIVLPANLLRAGMSIHVEGRFRHTGTGGTWSAGFRLGSLDTSSDNSCAALSGTAVDDQSGYCFQDVMILTGTSYSSFYSSAPQSTGAGALLVRSTNFDVASPLYLSAYTFSVNAADTVQLLAYEVWING